MALSVVITLLTLPPIVLFLLIFFFTNAYLADAPGGPDAMALFVPAALTLVAGLMLLVATWLCLARGGFDFISDRRALSSIVATLVTLGVCLAAVGVFLAWADRGQDWVARVGWLAGGVAPIGLCAILIACAWMPAPSNRTALRITYAPLALWSIVGLTAAGIVAGKALHRRSLKIQNQIAQAQAEEAEWERKRSRTPVEAAREDYSQMHPDSPLWSIAAGLPDYSDAESRAVIIARAFEVPNFESQLASTVVTAHPRYRHGCLDIIRFAPASQPKAQWSNLVARSIDVSAEQIKENSNWMIADSHSNPDPIEHIRAMVQAGKAVGNPQEVKDSLRRLSEVIQALPDESMRLEAGKALNAN